MRGTWYHNLSGSKNLLEIFAELGVRLLRDFFFLMRSYIHLEPRLPVNAL